jgi:hypothetical protein
MPMFVLLVVSATVESRRQVSPEAKRVVFDGCVIGEGGNGEDDAPHSHFLHDVLHVATLCVTRLRTC